jgi:prolyl 4-hydroxylase
MTRVGKFTAQGLFMSGVSDKVTQMSPSLPEHARALLAAGDIKTAVEYVTSAANRGDGDALYELGLWHVYGTPLARDFGIARTLFGRAGEAGHKTGALTHIVFVAIGAGTKADWHAAMKLLAKAAANDPTAARQCELIELMSLNKDGGPDRIPPVEHVSHSPDLRVIHALLSPAECAHVALTSAPHLMPSVVVDPRTGNQLPHPIRTSDSAVLGPLQQDVVIHALNLRIAAVTATREQQGEPLAVMRYAQHQQYRLHHDCLPGEANQRRATLIAYLNDGYSGGATHFPAIDHSIQGERGDAIFFFNTLADGSVDERGRHAGLPVTRGEKWICTRWIRSRDFDPWAMRRD